MKTNLFFLAAVAFLLVSCGGDTENPEPDCNQTDLAVSVESTTNDQCGQGVGEIVVAASGGEGDYEFSIDGSTFQVSGTFTGVTSGDYTISVRDAADCSKTTTTSVADSDSDISLEVASTNSDCGSSSGSITAEASGGEGALQYQLDDGSFGMSGTFGGVASGVHSVTVKDESGCETTEEVLVRSGISFANNISSIIETNCAVASCHAGTQAPDFREFSNIKANASTIKLRTGNGQMPPAGREDLTTDEIQAIACWVDDGALDN